MSLIGDVSGSRQLAKPMDDPDHPSHKTLTAAAATDDGFRGTYGYTIYRVAVEFTAAISDAQSALAADIRHGGGLVRMWLRRGYNEYGPTDKRLVDDCLVDDYGEFEPHGLAVTQSDDRY
jgi:hypothetical protein